MSSRLGPGRATQSRKFAKPRQDVKLQTALNGDPQNMEIIYEVDPSRLAVNMNTSSRHFNDL
jgi:hypothetical protein